MKRTLKFLNRKSTRNIATAKSSGSLTTFARGIFTACTFSLSVYAGNGDATGRTETKEISCQFDSSSTVVLTEGYHTLDTESLTPTSAYTPAAVTSTWKTAASGQWNVDSNWTNTPAQGGFPNDGNEGVATYDAVINANGFAYTVTLAQTETVEHLTLSSTAATLSITGGTFTAHTGIDLTAGSLLLSGGTISNSTINAASGTLNFSGSSNLLTGVAVTGDLNMTGSYAGVKIAGGTTFTTAHLANSQTAIGFAPGQTLAGTISLEGAGTGYRYIEMNGTAGTFTVGSTGVISTNTSFLGSGSIGSSSFYGGAMTLVNQGLISSQSGVPPLRLVAPMVRLVVHDYCTRSWGEGLLRHSLYYSERMYGCSYAWNKHFVEWLGFFEPWTDDSHQVPAAVKKNVLRDALAGQGIQTKKTETRDSLLGKAREVPGLLLDLIQKARPDRQQLRAEWKEVVQDWSQRVSAVEAAAVGVVKNF